jgi:hypothetical protein
MLQARIMREIFEIASGDAQLDSLEENDVDPRWQLNTAEKVITALVS